MAYRIDEKDSIFEVTLWGKSSRWEVLQIIHQLQSKDPRKELNDLWIISETDGVFFDEFPEIVKAIASLCAPDMVGKKSALVTTDEFIRVQLEMYKVEAAALPFEIQIFDNRADAVQWLNS